MSDKNDLCPVCLQEAVVTCRCPLQDSQCANGHEWHRCLVHDRIVLGPSDHAKDIRDCQCADVCVAKSMRRTGASKEDLVLLDPGIVQVTPERNRLIRIVVADDAGKERYIVEIIGNALSTRIQHEQKQEDTGQWESCDNG